MKTKSSCGASCVIILLLAAICLAGNGCDAGPAAGIGFRLPQGDVSKGKEAFLALRCHSCHTVANVALPAADQKAPFTVPLGGEVLRVKTYGELVTAIINPSHIISEDYKKALVQDGKLSPMPVFNQTMTVEQMINLVAFLQAQYRFPAAGPVIAH